MELLHEPVYDVVIIGGGPAGLSAALILARARRRIVVIDAGNPRNAVAHGIHGFLGRDGRSPADLRNAGQAELAGYACDVLRDTVTRAIAVSASERGPLATAFVVESEQGRRLTARKLLFATGMRDKLPAFAGVRECYGATIHHCPYCDGWEHRDQPLLAFGEESTDAVGMGLLLRGWSSNVTVLTNGHAVSAEDTARLKKNKIAWAQETIICFVCQGDQLEGVELKDRGLLPAKAMFFNTEEHSSCDLAATLGVTCDGDSAARTSRKQKTNVPGVFIAGDADGNVQLAIVAAGEGATAAVAINRELQKEDRA